MIWMNMFRFLPLLALRALIVDSLGGCFSSHPKFTTSSQMPQETPALIVLHTVVLSWHLFSLLGR